MKYFLMFALLIAVSCSSTKTETKYDALNRDNPVIILNKTPCFGRCPVYTFTLHGDGSAEFVGEKNVANVGIFRTQLPKEKVIEYIEKFEKINFFKLNDVYDDRVTDLPTSNISFAYNGQMKRIKARYHVPEELSGLIREIDSLAKAIDWKAAEKK